MKSTVELVKEALSKQEVDALLIGEKSYALPRPYMSPTELPTDWDALLKGIYELYNRDPSLINGIILEEALLKIVKDIRGAYSSLNVFWRQLMKEEHGVAPFKVNREQITKILSAYLRDHKNEFMKDKRWMGATEKNGLWDDVLRISKDMQEIYGIELINE